MNQALPDVQGSLFRLPAGSLVYSPESHLDRPSFPVTLVVRDFRRIQANREVLQALSHPSSRCILEYLGGPEDHPGQEYQEVLGFQGNQALPRVLWSL